MSEASQTSAQPLYGTALLKAKEILDYLLSAPEPPALKDIANHVSMTKPTVFKLLKTLEYCGFVRGLGEDKHYYLGTVFLSYAQKALGEFDIHLVAQPYLARLRDETNETVNLGVLEGKSVILLAKLESPNSVKLVSQIGKGMHLYSSAMGKALLSCYDTIDFEDYLQNTELVPLTENTITDRQKLADNIAQIRQRGYALENSENQQDIYCVGYPLMKNGRIYGAFSVSAPRYRVKQDNLSVFIKAGYKAQQAILKAI